MEDRAMMLILFCVFVLVALAALSLYLGDNIISTVQPGGILHTATLWDFSGWIPTP